MEKINKCCQNLYANNNITKNLSDFHPYLEDDDDTNEKNQNDDDPEISVREFTIVNKGEPPVFGRSKQTIPKYLEKKFNKLILQAIESMQTNDFKRKEGYLAPVKELPSDKEHILRTTDLWKTLLRDPPIKSFCVARALQLLNKSGLMREIPETIHPLLFNTKFALITNQSLPIPGQSITTAAPIKALATLYHDPKGLINKDKEKVDKTKQQSLEKIIHSFGAQHSATFNDIIEGNGLIVEPFSSQFHKIKVTNLRLQAKKLFETHFAHVTKVNKLLKKMFVLEKGPITLNPDILNKGVQGIEDIAHEARDLLSDYYSNCQTEYSKGVKILVSPEKEDNLPKKLIKQPANEINRTKF